MKTSPQKPTASELEMLQVLWSRGPSTVGDVLDALNEKKSMGYTGVLKLLQIMTAKGTVRRDEAATDLGLTVSLHAFRHTHASALIASGMDILTISPRLWHSSPMVTLHVYGRLFANTNDRAAQIIQAAFSSRTD
jgi:integrase